MKLATFELPTPAGPLRRLGAAVDGRIVDLAAAYAAHLDRTDPGSDVQPGDLVELEIEGIGILRNRVAR